MDEQNISDEDIDKIKQEAEQASMHYKKKLNKD